MNGVPPWMRGWPGILLGIVIAIFVVYPLIELVIATLSSGPSGEGVLHSYIEAFGSPRGLSSAWGTVWLTSVTLLFGVPLAVLLAWITSSTDAPLGRSLAMLPTLTLALSPLVGAIGWLVLLAPRVGMVNLAIRQVFGLDIEVGPFNAYSVPVIVMLMVFYIVPYVYGPTFAAFAQVDASLQEAARICGASNRWILFTVTLPILRPAVLAGGLIAGVMAASMFAIPLILSSGTGLHVIPTQIYHYINQEGRTGPAMAMASMLSIVTITAMVMYFRILGRGRFVTISGKGSRRVRIRLGPWRWLATAVVLLFLFLALIVPLGSLIYLSLVGFWSRNVFDQVVSFAQYRRLLDFPFAIDGLVNSAWLAMTGSVIALAVGLIVSYRRVRRPHFGNQALSFFSSLPLGVPSIVLGLAFLAAFTGGLVPLYGTVFILIVAYAVHMLPIAMRSSDAGLLQISPELEEAGLVCGDTRSGILRRILVPILRHPLLAAWGLCFIILYRDLSISILLYTPKTTPSSVALLQIFDQGWMTGAAAYSIIVTLISVLVVGLIIKSSTTTEAA